MFVIQGIVSKGKYLYAIVPTHPFANEYGYVLHHRVIMENFLCRVLTDEEEVHHKDLDSRNNDISNLMVVTKEQHRLIHDMYRYRTVSLVCCPWCSNYFYRYKNLTHLSKPGQLYTSCSRQCSSSFSRFIQLNGITPEVEHRININIQGEYKENFVTKELFDI